jgi:hypothetical protein
MKINLLFFNENRGLALYLHIIELKNNSKLNKKKKKKKVRKKSQTIKFSITCIQLIICTHGIYLLTLSYTKICQYKLKEKSKLYLQ